MLAAQSAPVLPIFSNFLAANIELRSVFKQTVVDTVPELAYSGELLLLSSLGGRIAADRPLSVTSGTV